MIAVAVVAGVSATLAAAAAAMTMSDRWQVDAVDPSAEQRQVERTLRRWRRRLRTLAGGRLDRWSAGAALLATSLVVLLAVVTVLGLLLEMVDDDSGLARADATMARWGADHATATSAQIIEWVTHLGARPVVSAALIAAVVIDWRRHRQREVALFALTVGLGEMLLVNGLKLLVDRDRPAVMQLVDAGGASFPSGHTSAAAAGWVAVALVLGRGRSRRGRATLAAAAVALAMAVATSRTLLGVHWVTDVIAGLAVGWGWYLAVAIVFGGRRQRLGVVVERAVPEVVRADDGHTAARSPMPEHTR